MKTFLIVLLTLIQSYLYADTSSFIKVDLDRYMGKWYEIASLPQRFSKDCQCTRAKYTLKENGKVKVYNSCNRKSPTGKFTDVTGRAKVADKNTNAKLKVSFFWPFYGDYWIIGLANDYRYAIVSNKDADSLWILSRTPIMRDQDFAEAIDIATKHGVDIHKIQLTNQKNCTYPMD